MTIDRIPRRQRHRPKCLADCLRVRRRGCGERVRLVAMASVVSTRTRRHKGTEVPIPCRVQIDGGTPQVVNPVGTVIFQITPTATTAVRINDIRLQSTTPGVSVLNPAYASIQQSILLQFGVYSVTPATGGLTPTPLPTDDVLIGEYNPSTSFRTFTSALGNGFLPMMAWQWNYLEEFTLRPSVGYLSVDRVSPQGADSLAVKSPAVWALIMPAPSGQFAFSMTGSVEFTEDH